MKIEQVMQEHRLVGLIKLWEGELDWHIGMQIEQVTQEHRLVGLLKLLEGKLDWYIRMK